MGSFNDAWVSQWSIKEVGVVLDGMVNRSRRSY